MYRQLLLHALHAGHKISASIERMHVLDLDTCSLCVSMGTMTSLLHILPGGNGALMTLCPGRLL
jgi:hypothetical protein